MQRPQQTTQTQWASSAALYRVWDSLEGDDVRSSVGLFASPSGPGVVLRYHSKSDTTLVGGGVVLRFALGVTW